MFVANSLKVFKNYMYLLQQLVVRDFKVKYKRSVLGVLWSVLNPLFTMIIMYVVFSAFFKLKDNTDKNLNYSVYLLSGIVFFNFFSEATNLSLGAVVNNFNLLTKVYMPKYIFPLSKVLSSAVNMIFSLLALYLIVVIQAFMGLVPFNWTNIIMIYDLFFFVVFCIGMGLVLSAVTVYFRDMYYIWGVVMTAWMYLTPIMYPMSMVEKNKEPYIPLVLFIMKLNPLYQFINFARVILLKGVVPTGGQFLFVFLWAFVMLIVGIFFFRKNQDNFVYHI